MTQIINYSLPIGDRISMRENLIQAFLRETPGTGIGDNASRYQYKLPILKAPLLFSPSFPHILDLFPNPLHKLGN